MKPASSKRLAALALLAIAAIVAAAIHPSARSHARLDPSNPFFAPSTLPFQAPPFDKIHDADYQPAI